MRKLFSLFLALVATTSLWAYDFQSGDLYYNITSSSAPYTVEVSDAVSSITTAVIPSTVTRKGTTYSVTSIGDSAFYYCYSLTSITIPNSVTSIGERAFYNCDGLTSITIPNSVTSIGISAFLGCSSLTSITIPNSVTSIGNYAFLGCSSLTSITIPNSVTSIGKEAFYECSSLTSITIPNSVTSIGEWAFFGCSGLTSITIPNSVTSIGNYAFSGCSSLTSITIPNSVTSIGISAFLGCSGLVYPVYNEHYFAYMPRSYKGAYIIPEGIKQIAGGAFRDCSNLTSITIPNSVTSIGESAFLECSGLTSVTIGNSVTSIGNGAFSFCESLTSITIPNSVTSIGYNAFDDCSSLTSVVWNVKNCADLSYSSHGPFYDICSQITSFTFGDSVQHIPAYMCYGMSNLTSVTIGNSVTSIGNYAFSGCSGLTSITIPNSVTSIEGYAFEYCSGLTSPVYNEHYFAYMPRSYKGAYIIPEGIKQIAGGAFRDCSNLTSITIPNSVTSIGDRAFYWCTSLTSITIPNSVISIGDRAFYWCTSLTSITIPNSVISIGNYAFDDCDGLTSITLGNSVTTIGDWAFRNCSGLTSIESLAEVPPTLGTYAFYDVPKNIPVYVPCSSVSAYQSAYGWNTFTNIQGLLVEYSIVVGVNDSIMGTAKVDYNTYCEGNQISATSNYGYHFVQWSDSNTDNPRTLVLTQDTILTAVFSPNQYSITTASADPERGSTAGDTIVNYLEYATISATANYGYHFAKWNDGNTDNPRVIKVTGDKTYTAQFDKNIYKITTYWDDQMGSVNAPNNAEYLDEITISATANYGYHFTQWNDGNTDNPRALVLTQDTALTAEFAPNQYQLSLATNYSEMGSVQGAGTYDYLTEIEISATANYGYHFTQWNDGNTDNPRTVQVIGDTTYTAQFDKNIYKITTYCDNQIGSVSAPDSAEYLDEITISATANYGYHFVQWSDGNTDNPRTLELTQDTILTAEFAVSYSGQCGDDLYWAYDEDSKKISITGSGDMYDYTKSTQPWLLFQEQITEVTTSNTTTSIGTSAFEGCIRLGKVSLGYGMGNIAANAFAECKRLYDIYVFASYPPFAEESSFANYNVYLYVPCKNQRDYVLDVVWGEFKFIECIGAESDDTGGDDVTVTPGTNDVTITWPTEDEAETYSIVITKDGEVFCTLTFNSNGQLLNIAFAPGREGNHPAQYAEAAANGYRFTVTGLKEGTKYAYNLDVKDSANQTIQSYSGEFRTMSDVATDIDNVTSTTNCQKLFRDGQLLIIRDGKTYTIMGAQIQ